MAKVAAPTSASGGIQNYYAAKIEELEVIVRERTQNLRRLEAQRNELNSMVRHLRETLEQHGIRVDDVDALDE